MIYVYCKSGLLEADKPCKFQQQLIPIKFIDSSICTLTMHKIVHTLLN